MGKWLHLTAMFCCLLYCVGLGRYVVVLIHSRKERLDGQHTVPSPFSPKQPHYYEPIQRFQLSLLSQNLHHFHKSHILYIQTQHQGPPYPTLHSPSSLPQLHDMTLHITIHNISPPSPLPIPSLPCHTQHPPSPQTQSTPSHRTRSYVRTRRRTPSKKKRE